MNAVQHRQGFALPVAVFALVVVGALVTGGFYLARQETRIGMASQRETSAFYLAERGAMEVMSEWDMSRFSSLTPWGTATVTGTVPEGSWSVGVTRMTDRLYFLQSTGTVTQGSARLGNAARALGMVARLIKTEISPMAALTTVGNLTLGGSSFVNGYDVAPPAWGSLCGPTGPNKPGVLIDDVGNIRYVGTSFGISGIPPKAQDKTLTSEDLLKFGEFEWSEIVALADLRIPGGATFTKLSPDSALVGGSWVCRKNLLNNWGDPGHPAAACGSYFPLIYAAGDLSINSSDSGQGILLVEGNLSVQGGHSFYGPVIVKGELKTAGTGGHFNGGVIAANVYLDTSTVLGNALVQYSKCSVERAILNNSSLTRVRPLERRSWVDLSSVISG